MANKLVVWGLMLLGLASCKHENDLTGFPHPDDGPAAVLPCPDSVVDIDGNVYQVIDVDGTCWTASNLKVSRFSNGDSIPLETSGGEWIQLNASAQCYYDNDSVNLGIYGRLYNGYSVMDDRGLCPTGWKVPQDSDWVNLANFLGGEGVAGDKLKSLDLWYGPGTPATDAIGFTAKPGGSRILQGNGTFIAIGDMGNWWSATENGSEVLVNRQITYINSNLAQASNSKKVGFSVRCIRAN